MINTEKIQPDKLYSPTEMARNEFFPWVKSERRAYIKTIMLDREKRNLLKAIIQGEDEGTRYHVLGKNIVDFVKAMESGEYRL